MFTNLDNSKLVKKDGDLSGQPVAIENCHVSGNFCVPSLLHFKNSFILVLDNLASVTVDDCKDCLIILGPCQGRYGFLVSNLQFQTSI
jgi:hypothetical protein